MGNTNFFKVLQNCIICSGNNTCMMVKENGKEFKIDNPNCKKLEKIRVDGCMITSGVRCDYAVLVDRNSNNLNDVYLIELKGCDVKHGYEQLLETYKFFKSNSSCSFDSKTMHLCLVISKKSKPMLKSTAEKRIDKLKNDGYITFRCKSKTMTQQV